MSENIEGLWKSRYEYESGATATVEASEHQVTFTLDNSGLWVGKSTPSPEGSELTVSLHLGNDEFRGEWHERTSPGGSYQGREFSGIILLTLQSDGMRLVGKWLGVSSGGDVKSGNWTFDRKAS